MLTDHLFHHEAWLSVSIVFTVASRVLTISVQHRQDIWSVKNLSPAVRKYFPVETCMELP